MKTMAISFFLVAALAFIIGGLYCMKTRHTKSYGVCGVGGSFVLGAGITFFMTAGPASLRELLRV